MTPEKISCGICRDLLPLVLDGVAAPESEAAVRAHLAACPECRAVWQAECGDTPSPAPDTLPDDARILCRLRRRVRGWLALALAAALLVALFAYTVNGDPISGAWAQQRAIRYVSSVFPARPLPRRKAAGIPTISIIRSRCNPTKALIPISQWRRASGCG